MYAIFRSTLRQEEGSVPNIIAESRALHKNPGGFRIGGKSSGISGKSSGISGKSLVLVENLLDCGEFA
jgi:hypothetical protein